LQDGSAGLNLPMTRGQFAKVIANIFELELQPGAPVLGFTEPTASQFYQEGYIQAVVAAGIMVGGPKADGTYGFRPNDNVSFEELVVVLIRALGLEGDAAAFNYPVEGIVASWARPHVGFALALGLVQPRADYRETAIRSELVSVSFEVNEVYQESKVFEVVSVSAITKTIEVNVAVFEAEENATANVAIFALNDEGEKTGNALVTANAATIDENVVTFDVSTGTFGDDEYVIEVTIDGETITFNVELEFKTVEELVADIIAANEAQLAGLLANDTYFTGFDVAKVDDYKTNVSNAASNLKTVANVQELVIDALAATAEFAAFVKELTETNGKYAKYLVLKGQFSNVLAANMDDYLDPLKSTVIFNINTATAGSATSFKDISDAIDKINLDAVVGTFDNNVKTIVNATKPSKLTQAKTALESLVLVNATVTSTITGTTVNAKTKAQILTAINAQLKAIADARTAANAEIVKAEAALAAFVTANEGVPTGHNEYDAVVAEIAELQKADLAEDQLAIAILTGAVTALKGKTEEFTIIEDTLAALAAFVAAFEVNNSTAGNVQSVYTSITPTILVDITADPVVYAGNNNSSDLKTALNNLKAETAEWVTYNAAIAATTATEMRTLLFALQLTNEFTNLTPNAAKGEFAQYVIDALAEATTPPGNYADLRTAIFTTGTGYLADYKTLISDVNGATNIAGMITALENISADYGKLGAEAKADIADAVFEVRAELNTLAQIKAAMGL
jgi:hypothetical protein